MTISMKADAGGTFGEILVNGTQVAKFTPGGNAVIPGAVGTVSESGGIPTGAIIERGSNANGSFTKFADGTLICTASKSAADVNPIAHTFPAAFAGGAVVSLTNDHTTFASNATQNVSNTTFTFHSSTASNTIYVTAIGRWF